LKNQKKKKREGRERKKKKEDRGKLDLKGEDFTEGETKAGRER